MAAGAESLSPLPSPRRAPCPGRARAPTAPRGRPSRRCPPRCHSPRLARPLHNDLSESHRSRNHLYATRRRLTPQISPEEDRRLYLPLSKINHPAAKKRSVDLRYERASLILDTNMVAQQTIVSPSSSLLLCLPIHKEKPM